MLYLASQSPRRRELLQEAGINFEAFSPGQDDAELVATRAADGTMVDPAVWTAGLAFLKAVAGVETLRREDRLRTGDVVLGADTICVGHDANGRAMILSAPASEAEARAMLAQWQDGEHDVLTGVALVRAGAIAGAARAGSAWERAGEARTIFVDRARVRWGRVSEIEIEGYLRSGSWRGKAGAYNLRERLGAGWPIAFAGDPATIMGLPMRRLGRALGAFGGREVCDIERAGWKPAPP